MVLFEVQLHVSGKYLGLVVRDGFVGLLSLDLGLVEEQRVLFPEEVEVDLLGMPRLGELKVLFVLGHEVVDRGEIHTVGEKLHLHFDGLNIRVIDERFEFRREITVEGVFDLGRGEAEERGEKEKRFHLNYS